MKAHPTIVFITALPLEHDAVVKFLQNVKPDLRTKHYTVGDYASWRVIVRKQIEEGNSQARADVNWFIEEFKPEYVFFVGVAGGIKDVAIGDVVIASKVIGYEKGKAKGKIFQSRAQVQNLRTDFIETAHHLIDRKSWTNKISNSSVLPNAYVKPIASGEKVIVSTAFLRQLNQFASDAVAIDMEGIGFLQGIADNPNAKGIIVRGISDLCSSKSKNSQNDRINQPIAAHHAAAFAFALLDELSLLTNILEEQPISPPTSTTLFTIPFARNPRFIDRQDILAQLHTSFTSQKLVALCGLGGVGKTQLAVEYVYRYQQAYSAILWCSLSSEIDVSSSFAKLATEIGLSIQQENEHLVNQLKYWLNTHQNWLLVIDNIDESSYFQDIISLLPKNLTNGYVLFTTRQYQPPLPIRGIPIGILDRDEGAKFIIQLAHNIPATEASNHFDYEPAKELSDLLGGLPLALMQATAYIREHCCCCSEYIELYQEYQRDLLTERGELLDTTDHPASVVTTFTMSLKQVAAKDARAIELLNCCAVLSPIGIPEEVLMAALSLNKLQLNTLLKPILSYSLLTRSDRQVNIHKLVQAVVRFELGNNLSKQVENMITVVEQLFPDTEDANPEWAKREHWQRCESLLTSALACAEEIQQLHLATKTAACLLERMADYLRWKADYKHSLRWKADYKHSLDWYNHTLEIYEKMVGKEQLETISIRNKIVRVLYRNADYNNAVFLGEETLEISRRILGNKHLKTAESLLRLGWVQYYKSNYDEALSLCQQALDIHKQLVGEFHNETADSLGLLAAVYLYKANYQEKVLLTEQMLAIREQYLGKEHPDTAAALNDLAWCYQELGKYEKALLFYERALDIKQKILGKEHNSTATGFSNLGWLCQMMGDYDRALPLITHSIDIKKRIFGEDNPVTIIAIHKLAVTYRNKGDYEQALPLFKHSLTIREQKLDSNHPRLAQSYYDLGILYQRQGHPDKALNLLQQALAIRKRKLGTDHPDTARTYGELALVYQAQGEIEKAKQYYEQALTILKQRLGEQHPNTQTIADNYNKFLSTFDIK